MIEFPDLGLYQIAYSAFNVIPWLPFPARGSIEIVSSRDWHTIHLPLLVASLVNESRVQTSKNARDIAAVQCRPLYTTRLNLISLWKVDGKIWLRAGKSMLSITYWREIVYQGFRDLNKDIVLYSQHTLKSRFSTLFKMIIRLRYPDFKNYTWYLAFVIVFFFLNLV